MQHASVWMIAINSSPWLTESNYIAELVSLLELLMIKENIDLGFWVSEHNNQDKNRLYAWWISNQQIQLEHL